MHRLSYVCAVAVCAIGVGACASASPSSARTQTVSVEGAGSLHINSNASASTKTLPFPIDRVWRVMPAVFDSLGIPITRLDAPTHTIMNEGAKGRQRLKGVSFSQYIDCGESQIGPNADSYDIFYTVTTQVTSTGPNSTQVATLVEGSARPLSFSQEYNRCTSKGALEAKIADLVRAKLQG